MLQQIIRIDPFFLNTGFRYQPKSVLGSRFRRLTFYLEPYTVML